MNTPAKPIPAHVQALTDEHIETMRREAEDAGEEEVAELCASALAGDASARSEVADLLAGVDGWGGGLGWRTEGHPVAVAYDSELEHETYLDETEALGR